MMFLIASRKRVAGGGPAGPQPQQYCVAGAGTTAYNGTYTEAGTYDSKPYYTDGLGHYLYSCGAGQWVLYTELVIDEYLVTVDYMGPGTSTTPDDGIWSVNMGAGPYPTVTDGACA